MARNSDVALALIGRIYDAAAEPTLWPETLTTVADAVGGAQVMMGIHDLATRSTAIVAPRIGPLPPESNRTNRRQVGIPRQRINRTPASHVLYAERFAARAKFTPAELRDKWYRPLGLDAAGPGVNLHVEGNVPAVCGIRRPAREDTFAARDIALFELIAPHLVRALDVQRRFWRLALAREPAAAAADPERGHEYSILVDAGGTVALLDDAAKRSLDAGDGLRLENGHIKPDHRAASRELDRVVGTRLAYRRTAGASGGEFTIPRHKARPPLRVLVSPFRAGSRNAGLAWLGLSRPAAIIVVSDPERARHVSTERLRTRFGLTPAEAELAREISKGDGRKAAAARLGISVGTVRTHLMRIFEKAGVRRQAELVRLVLERPT